MDFATTSRSRRAAASTKIVIAGGFGVGKTTLVGAVSEIVPLRTEALVTNESEGVDDLAAVPGKHTTTVAMDFGRLTLDYFESKGLPFIVAVNQFDGTREYTLDEVAGALALRPEVPIIRVDARDRESAKEALVRVTEYALMQLTQSLSVNAN